MAYSNGQIPDSALVTISGGARLVAPAADAWGRVQREVQRRYGWTPQPTGPLDGYRPLSGNYYAQTETFLRRYQPSYTQYAIGKKDQRKWNGRYYWRKAGTAAAAVPGTSNHGWGAAVDVTGLGGFYAVRYAQFSDVATEYGWSNVEGRSINEYWHWVHTSTAQLVKNGQTTGGSVPSGPDVNAPTPIAPKEWDEMASKQEIQDAVAELVNKAVADAVAKITSTLAKPVEVYFFTHQGGTYEAQVDENTYRRIPNTQDVADRRTILTRAGVRWENWNNKAAGNAEVANPDAFGILVK